MAVAHFAFRNIVHDSALPIPYGVHELAATFEPPDPDLAMPEEAARPRYEAAFARFCAGLPRCVLRPAAGPHPPRPAQGPQAERGAGPPAQRRLSQHVRLTSATTSRSTSGSSTARAGGSWTGCGASWTSSPRRRMRQHADYIFYERAESKTIKGPAFDFVRSEDKSATSPAMIRRLAEVYLANARESLRGHGGDAHAIPVLERFFRDRRRRTSGGCEQERLAAEPSHLAVAAGLRRPGLPPPADGGRARPACWGSIDRCAREGRTTRAPIRDALARVLMSPSFLYLHAEPSVGAPRGPARVTGVGARPWTTTRWPAG